MPSQKLADLQTELDLLINQIGPEIEGLTDFARLNLLPATKAKVLDVTKDSTRRMDCMRAASKALIDLVNDGYPDSPIKIVTGDIFNDLQSNVTTLAAAFAKFAPADEAVAATIVPGTPVTRPPPEVSASQ